MNYIFKMLIVFLLSLVLIFCLAACNNGEKGDNPSSDISSSDKTDTSSNSSSLSGGEDGGIDVNDILGENPSSSEEGSGSGSDKSSSENESSSSSSSSSSSNVDSSFNYEDKSVWTDPV